MMRFLLALCFFFLMGCLFAHPQNPTDSLKKLLKTSIADSIRIKVLNQLSFRLSGNLPDESLLYAQEALKLALATNNERGISKSYNSLGVVMRVQGDYLNALSYFFQALKIDEKLEDDSETAKTLSGIGAVYARLRNYDKALEFFEKSLSLRKKINDKKGIAVSYTNMADIHHKKGNYALAIELHQKALDIERLLSPADIHYSLHSLGNIFYDLHEFQKAEKAYSEALQMRKNLRNKFIIAETMIHLGRVLAQEERFGEAYGYLDEGLAIAKANQAKELELKAYLFFSELYEQQKNPQKALDFYKKYTQMNDSLYNSEVNKQNKRLYEKYQEEKIIEQAKENAFLKKNQQLQNKYLEKQKTINQLIVIGSLVSFVLAVSLFYFLYQNQKINKELREKNEEIEQKNQQLSLQHAEILEVQQQLEEVNEELLTFNHQLENMVQERTAKIEQANQAYKEAKEELEVFMYRISHDFRGPLATLAGLAMIGRNETQDATAHLFFSKTEHTVYKLGRLLDKLSMVYLISNKTIQNQEIDFRMMLQNIAEQVSLGKSDTQLKVNVQDFRFVSDAEIVNIILYNLLENAYQFQNPEADCHQINVTIQKAEKVAQIIVEDNGMGIPREFQERMFDMFFRASETSQGNGLGLYIVKKAVEKLEGTIAVESQENRFTRFVVELPAV